LSFLKKSECLNIIVQELAYAAPTENWKKIVYYTERLRDIEIGLRDASIGKCWVGQDEKLYDTSKGPALTISVELDDAIDELYKLTEGSNDQWHGLGIVLTNNGKYLSKFYYEGTPLIDNVLEKYTLRLKALSDMSL
jgi:hypothetical protein